MAKSESTGIFQDNKIFYMKDKIKPKRAIHIPIKRKERMFYLKTHSAHFIYGYMESDIW